MPNNIITFRVNDRDARAGFSRLKRDVDQLETELEDSRRDALAAGNAIDRLGTQSRGAARDVERLGGLFRDTNGRLRDTRGRFIGASQGVETLTRSLGGMRGILTGLGIAAAAREVFEFGVASVQAAGRMEGLRRGLQAIEGSDADARLRDFNEIAKLPGLNTPQIIRYSNSLRSAGATTTEVDAIITTFGQSIVGLGGNAVDTSRAMLQLTQAFGENKISQENFSTIKELIPSFNRFAKEVYNTDGSMDALNQTFKASGQTLGQFLLPVLAKLRQEIPAAPVDSYARSIDALSEEFEQFKIAIGTELLPIVASTARGLASLFDTMTKGVQVVSDFFDIVDERHNALLNASDSAREFAARLAEINTATGQTEAVDARISTLQRLTTALRIEQSELSHSSNEYLEYAKRIRDAANEIDFLRSLQQASAGTGDVANEGLINQRTQALEKAQAEVQRYEQALARAREEAVGQTNPAIQQLERRLEAQRTTAATLTREIELLKNGFQDIAPTVNTAAGAVVNYSLAIAKLRAEAEDAQDTQDFQAAITASNAYYDARIAKAQQALAAETAGTEAYNTLETQIFELRRQRLQTAQRLETERQNSITQLAQQRIDAANAVRDAEVEGFNAATQAATEFQRHIAAIPRLSSADAQYGNFTSQLRQDFEDTEQQGRSLLSVMREIVRLSLGSTDLDLEARIPDPGVRQQQIDDRIAAEARGAQTLTDIRQDALEQGTQFLNTVLRREERDIQRSINASARQYRQFANLVSNTFLDLATGRAQRFETVATAFIQQSLRIVARAFIEHQLRLRLDDTLTAHKIANIQKVNAVQQAAGAGGLGNLAGLENLSGLGRLGGSLSGGGAALGVSALLFPEQIRNLTGGITDTIGNLLSNVASAPDRAFGAQQLFIKIGDNEARDISDLQEELKLENRA